MPHVGGIKDKARRFTSSDLYDFEHASAALAYCQLFFTEDWLHSTITVRHIPLDQLFHCRVASDISGANEALNIMEAEVAQR
jgi:hypothetical protein